MKLISLSIKEFKNLKDFTISFENEKNLTMVIGNNGSGKSNIIEAISSIFLALYSGNTSEFSFTLVYENNNSKITMTAEKDGFPNITVDDNEIKFTTSKMQDILPDKVVAIYSGEDDRLYKRYFEKPYLAYSKKLLKPSNERLKMQYINKNFWGIALLVLSLDGLDETNKFLREQLKIEGVGSVEFYFDLKMIDKNKYEPLNVFINQINPDKLDSVSIQFERLKEILSGKYPREIFTLFSQAAMYEKVKTITNINITFDSDYGLLSMSEGEKKLILLKMILEVLCDEKTLVLMDEPDAFIHEGRKIDLYNMFVQYPNIEKIITTHSPTLANSAELSMIKMINCNSDGEISIVPEDKIKVINKLTNNEWSVVQQNIILQSKRPLLLVEGKGDVDYIKKAISVLDPDDSIYNLKIDIFPFGGAQNAAYFIEQFKPCVREDKQVVVLFDRDKAGGDGMNAIIGKGKDRADINTYKHNGWYYLKLPKTDEHTYLDFLIEDYFSKNHKKSIAQAIIDEADGNFNLYSKALQERIKKDIGDGLPNYNRTTMNGFSVLLDKLARIITGTEEVEIIS